MVEYIACQATRADGSPCNGRARPSGFCFSHDPLLAEARTEGATRGGHGRSKAMRLQRMLDARLARISDLLIDAIREVHEGGLAPARAQAMSALASAYLKVFETAELCQRVEELEGLLRGEGE